MIVPRDTVGPAERRKIHRARSTKSGTGRAGDSSGEEEDDGGRPLVFVRDREIGHLDVAVSTAILRRSSPVSRSFVLALLRALHLDGGCGTARLLGTTPLRTIRLSVDGGVPSQIRRWQGTISAPSV